jgi:hypothetical protein
MSQPQLGPIEDHEGKLAGLLDLDGTDDGSLAFDEKADCKARGLFDFIPWQRGWQG